MAKYQLPPTSFSFTTQIGASVFYSNAAAQITEIPSNSPTELDSLDKQITMAMENADPDSQLSSYVWICTSTHAASTVTVLDAKNPSVVLDSFPVCQNHLLCICSVPGALERDYALMENSEVTKAGETLEQPGVGDDRIGRVEFIRVEKTNAVTTTTTTQQHHRHHQQQQKPSSTDDDASSIVIHQDAHALGEASDAIEMQKCDGDANVNATPSPAVPQTKSIALDAVVEDIIVPPISPINLSRNAGSAANAFSLAFSKPVNPILGSPNPLEEPPMSSVGPSMWLGAQNGMLYVHSSVARWRECLHQVYLPDAVISIVHVESRVIAALANGKVAVFRRQLDGQWDLNSYHLVTLGLPKQSVRCLCVVADKIWAAHRNKIFIIDPITLNVVHTLEAHPRKESQIRQMAATGLGVWVSIR